MRGSRRAEAQLKRRRRSEAGWIEDQQLWGLTGRRGLRPAASGGHWASLVLKAVIMIVVLTSIICRFVHDNKTAAILYIKRMNSSWSDVRRSSTPTRRRHCTHPFYYLNTWAPQLFSCKVPAWALTPPKNSLFCSSLSSLSLSLLLLSHSSSISLAFGCWRPWQCCACL